MANATIPDSVPSNPGGTGSTITVTLPTHSAGQVIKIGIGNTGNTLWTGNPAGWTRLDQKQVGTSANGLVQTFFQRLVLPGDTLPLANPTFTLGATVSRMAFAWAEDGASKEGVFTLPAWSARAFNTGTANPVRPGTITTPAPEGLITTVYFQRAATNAPDPSGYTQDEEVIISGTLVGNLSHKTVADQQTVLSNQDASPTSGVRWCAAIFCTPSANYPYYRSASQATATGTSVTPGLPAGTTATDVNGNKDFMIITVEGAGSTTLSMQDGAWSEIGIWDTTTSGGGSTISKFWAYMTSTPPSRQANRTGSGEISANICTYYNTHQSSPIGATNIRQNASSNTSTWDPLTRTSTKVIVTTTCIADATPSFTAPTGWTERLDGLGITTADQIYNGTGSSASASFTLSAGNPTAVGLVEIKGEASVSELSRTAVIDGVATISSSAQFFSIISGSVLLNGEGAVSASGDRVVSRAVALDAGCSIEASGSATAPAQTFERSSALNADVNTQVAAAFFSVFERATVIDGSSAIECAALFFTEIERSVTVGVTVALESSAQFFSVLESGFALSISGGVSVQGAAFSIAQSASAFSAIVEIGSAGEVQSGLVEYESSASVDASPMIDCRGQRSLLRSLAFSTTGAVIVAGGIPSTAFRVTSLAQCNREGRIQEVSAENRRL